MVNFAVKSVRAAISSRISGKSTRGSRAAISLRSHTRLGGSSSLSGEVRPVRPYHPPSQLEPMGSMKGWWRPADTSDLVGGQVLGAFLQPTENGPKKDLQTAGRADSQAGPLNRPIRASAYRKQGAMNKSRRRSAERSRSRKQNTKALRSMRSPSPKTY